MLFRLLVICLWLTASFSAHAEEAREHMASGQAGFAFLGGSVPDEDGTHCASACVIGAMTQAKVSDERPAPEPFATDLPPAIVPATLFFEPRHLPPVRAGPDPDAEPPPHLRDLGSVRLLI